MNKLTLELPDETVAQLRRLAERLGTPMESLATAKRKLSGGEPLIGWELMSED